MLPKLYLVTVRGCRTPPGVDFHESYVVADSTDDAYNKVRTHLTNSNIGTKQERELESIKLLAEESDISNTCMRLFL